MNVYEKRAGGWVVIGGLGSSGETLISDKTDKGYHRLIIRNRWYHGSNDPHPTVIDEIDAWDGYQYSCLGDKCENG